MELGPDSTTGAECLATGRDDGPSAPSLTLFLTVLDLVSWLDEGGAPSLTLFLTVLDLVSWLDEGGAPSLTLFLTVLDLVSWLDEGAGITVLPDSSIARISSIIWTALNPS